MDVQDEQPMVEELAPGKQVSLANADAQLHVTMRARSTSRGAGVLTRTAWKSAVIASRSGVGAHRDRAGDAGSAPVREVLCPS